MSEGRETTGHLGKGQMEQSRLSATCKVLKSETPATCNRSTKMCKNEVITSVSCEKRPLSPSAEIRDWAASDSTSPAISRGLKSRQECSTQGRQGWGQLASSDQEPHPWVRSAHSRRTGFCCVSSPTCLPGVQVKSCIVLLLLISTNDALHIKDTKKYGRAHPWRAGNQLGMKGVFF